VTISYIHGYTEKSSDLVSLQRYRWGYKLSDSVLPPSLRGAPAEIEFRTF